MVGSILDLDPVRRAAATVGSVAVLRNRALKSHQAGVPQQIRPDRSLLEVGKENAIDAPLQQLLQVRFAEMQRYPPQVIAIDGEYVESVKLHLVIVLAAVQAIEIRSAIDAEQNGLAITNELMRFRSAASAISGKRSLQSLPMRVNSRTRLPSRWMIRR